jgi:hypothetical protein
MPTFSGQGKNYAQFPDRQSFRIYLEDLRDDAVRGRLTTIWTDAASLDPAPDLGPTSLHSEVDSWVAATPIVTVFLGSVECCFSVPAVIIAAAARSLGQAWPQATGDDRRIFDDGLVLILKELHDRLDAAVADAYGWPADLADNDILARLVALNKERAQEEARGIVRWLRPDYQIPRFGTAAQKAELDLVGGADTTPDAATAAGPKPLFPADDMAQTAAVMAALANAAAPLDAAALAAQFRQGRRAGPKIASVLGALLRMGFVANPDGGGTFSLRRAA